MRDYEGEQNELHSTEPELYQLIAIPEFKKWVLGDTERTVGFCVNSPGADGYSDETCVWISDAITDPKWFATVCIHECLHSIFPDLTEEQVDRAADQIGGFVAAAFKAKKAPLPELKRILTPKNGPILFPELYGKAGPR